MNVIEAIREAGVVGAGGAGFPTHVKLAARAEHVLLNGAECEPLLRVDQLAMRHRAARVVRGLELAMEATGAKRGAIATKAHYHEAVQALRDALAGKPEIGLHLLDAYYPSGDEKTVIYEVTGRVVPTAKLPADVGCVVINVGTALCVADAVEGRPVIEKSLTLCGEVPRPMTVTVPLGVSFREALGLSGFTGGEAEYALIVGGPCMGELAEDWDAPVTKTTGGLLALRRGHPLVRQRLMPLARQAKLARAICCQCSHCTQLCPRHAMGLAVEPHKAMRAIATGNAELLGRAAGVLGCSGCGLCTNFACEMGLAPSVVMAELKRQLTAAGIRPEPEAEIRPEPRLELKNVPVKRLMARMGLTAYDHPAPLSGQTLRPRSVKLPLRQHVGKPAEPVVRQGEPVRKGQPVARIPEGALGAAVHASINGTVAEVAQTYLIIKSE